MIQLIDAPKPTMFIGAPPFVVKVAKNLYGSVVLQHRLIAAKFGNGRFRNKNNVVNFLSDCRKYALTAVNAVADVVPILASNIIEAKDVASMDAHAKVKRGTDQPRCNIILNLMREIGSKADGFKGSFQNEDVSIPDAKRGFNLKDVFATNAGNNLVDYQQLLRRRKLRKV
jgi:hypothetical protein